MFSVSDNLVDGPQCFYLFGSLISNLLGCLGFVKAHCHPEKINSQVCFTESSHLYRSTTNMPDPSPTSLAMKYVERQACMYL